MRQLLPARSQWHSVLPQAGNCPSLGCQPVSVGVNVYCARLGVLLVWSRQVSVMGAFHAHAPTSSLSVALPPMLFTPCYVCIVLKGGAVCVLCFCFSSPFKHQELEFTSP